MNQSNYVKDFFEIFRICFKIILKKDKLKTVVWITLSLIVSLIPSLLIVLNRNIINKISNINEYGILMILSGLVALVGFIQITNGFIQAIMNYVYKQIKNSIEYELREELYKKLISINIEKLEDNNYYDLISKANTAITKSGLDNINYIIQIINDCISIISVIVVLIVIHWSLPLALILSMVPGFVGTIIAKNINYKKSVELIACTRMEGYISSLFFNKNALREIRIFKVGNYLINKWKKIFCYVTKKQIEVALKEDKIMLSGSSVLQISSVIASIFLIYNIYIDNITVGDYVALTEAMDILKSKMGDIAMNIGELFEIALYNKSFFEILDLSNDNGQETIKELNGDNYIDSLELNNVSFKYPNSDNLVLKNISLKIKKGQKVAIVGYNGSGKSTLINIILGNYLSIDGEYKINGITMNEENIKKYQSNMTTILQDFVNYKLSIRENVSLGNIDEIENDYLIKEHLKKVGILDKTNELKKGIDTLLTKEYEDGTEFSGGQWQKIAIARAMFKKSDLVIVDEPTSALDPIAELEVFNLLNNVTEGKTTIMISHRLGMTKFADLIIVMKNGRVIEQGCHEELMKKNGDYRHMYITQSKYYK